MIIDLMPGKVLIKPIRETSSFSSEHKKYERNSLGEVIQCGADLTYDFWNTTIVYDDSHSIDFRYDNQDYSIIEEKDICGIIEGGKHGETNAE